MMRRFWDGVRHRFLALFIPNVVGYVSLHLVNNFLHGLDRRDVLPVNERIAHERMENGSKRVSIGTDDLRWL